MFPIALSLLAPAFAEDALPAPAAGPTTYELDAGASRLYVLVKYDRNALIAGHDHVVAASDFTGRVTWDPTDPSVCDVKIDFAVTALTVDRGASRSWEGLEGSTSEGDKRTITDNLRSKDQLGADRFPRIAFTSRSCEASGAGFRVSGDLGIHGVTAPVKATMQIQADGARFSARGSFTASHGTWGMDPFSAMFGSLKNADDLKFVIDVKGRPAGQ